MKIAFFYRKDIDVERWDHCVQTATNGMPYAYSWYLDIVCSQQWGALVSEDYQYIMPLPYNQKFLFFKQIYQPYLAQQLGVLGLQAVTPSIQQAFLEAIPAAFLKVYTQLNEANTLLDIPKIVWTERLNYTLSLNDDYAVLSKQYSNNQKRNIKKGQKNELDIQKIAIATFIPFYKAQSFHLSKKVYKIIDPLIQKLLPAIEARNLGEAFGVYTKEGQLCAAFFLLRSHGRLIYLLARSSEEGKALRAMHFLIDSMIAENAKEAKFFDFEGSSIPSIARFFRGFGAVPQVYNGISRSVF